MSIQLPKIGKRLVLSGLLGLGSTVAIAGTPGVQHEIVEGSSSSKHPRILDFNGSSLYKMSQIDKVLAKYLKSDKGLSFHLVGEEKDQYGFSHYKFEKRFEGTPILGANIRVHVKNGEITSITGNSFKHFSVSGTYSISEQTAVRKAVKTVDAVEYMWEDEAEMTHLRSVMNDENLSFSPKGEKFYVPSNLNDRDTEYRPAYKVNVYAKKPLSRADYFVDAETNQVIFENQNILHAGEEEGIGETEYIGDVVLTTQRVPDGEGYRLQDDTRGGGVRTFDMRETTNYNAASDFIDMDNYWDNREEGRLTNYAIDAHYGAQSVYDFYFNNFGRNSLDDNGFPLISYVNYDVNYVNAFWNGQYMTYGAGNPAQGVTPLCSVDICGHEVSHGLISRTSNLVYQGESGALNESFADIFGTSIEYDATLETFDWLVGEDIGLTLRSMSNPLQYGDPDTYEGTQWKNTAPGSADNGGVHSNSGVQNFWFYLLSEGGTGTNDKGVDYNVKGIGVLNAAAVAYRNCVFYLSENSDYQEARLFSIRAAEEIFGPCTDEVQAVADAWTAVGVEGNYSVNVTANFDATTLACDIPFEVDFSNLSTSGKTYSWDFGDGSTSTDANPTHTYNEYGTYNVSLKTDGGECGIDRTTKQEFIVVEAKDICEFVMGTTSEITDCSGILYDNGGPLGNYGDLVESVVTLNPDAASISLEFEQFDLEADFDYLYIYEGLDVNAPLFGTYSANELQGQTLSFNGPVTLRLSSDEGLSLPGFKINFSCSDAENLPVAKFSVNPISTCEGIVEFTNESIDDVDVTWDFGDGTTSNSTDRVITHQYDENGTYEVTLTVSNANGTSVKTITEAFVINKPLAPAIENVSSCGPDNIVLNAEPNGETQYEWFNSAGDLVFTGNQFDLGLLTASETYYVEAFTTSEPAMIGAEDNTLGGGGIFNGNQGLLINVEKDLIIRSVKFYAEGAGERTVAITENGQVLSQVTVFVPDGESRVNLNLEVPAGEQLVLTVLGQKALFRNNGGVEYPFTVDGLMEITETTASQTGTFNYYYFFYDMEVKALDCRTLRKEVKAIIAEDVPTVSIEKNLDQVCEEEEVELTAVSNDAAEIVWSTNESGDMIAVNAAPGTTTYELVARNACGESTASFELTANPLPVITSISDNVSKCAGDADPVVISSTADNADDISWSPFGETTSEITYTGDQPEVFELTASNACGSVSEKVQVVLLSEPSVEVAGDDAICLDDYAILRSVITGSGDITWEPGGAESVFIEARPEETTEYTVTVTNPCGTATASFNLEVVQPADIVVTGLVDVICGDEVLDLEFIPAGGQFSGNIDDNGVIDASTFDPGVNYIGYVVTSPEGCFSLAKFDYTINESPENPEVLVDGSTLTSSVTGTTYLWYGDGEVIAGENSVSIDVSKYPEVAYFEVEVFNGDCSSGISETGYYTSEIMIDPAQVSVYPVPFGNALTIEVNDIEVASIVLLDNTGKQVKELELGVNSGLDNLAAGQYIIEITSVNGLKDRRALLHF